MGSDAVTVPRTAPITASRVAMPYRWALRAVITLHALDVFAQPVLAGRFLAGDYDTLALHSTNAIIVGIIGYVQIVAAILYWWPAGGAGWPVLAAFGVSAAETVQIILGFERVVGVHVPLGVAIISTMVVLLVWVWRRDFGSRRAGARRRPA